MNLFYKIRDGVIINVEQVVCTFVDPDFHSPYVMMTATRIRLLEGEVEPLEEYLLAYRKEVDKLTVNNLKPDDKIIESLTNIFTDTLNNNTNRPPAIVFDAHGA